MEYIREEKTRGRSTSTSKWSELIVLKESTLDCRGKTKGRHIGKRCITLYDRKERKNENESTEPRETGGEKHGGNGMGRRKLPGEKRKNVEESEIQGKETRPPLPWVTLPPHTYMKPIYNGSQASIMKGARCVLHCHAHFPCTEEKHHKMDKNVIKLDIQSVIAS